MSCFALCTDVFFFICHPFFLTTSLTRHGDLLRAKTCFSKAHKDFMRYKVFLRKWDFSNSVHPQNEIRFVYYVNCGSFFFLFIFSILNITTQTKTVFVGKKIDHKEIYFYLENKNMYHQSTNLACLLMG